MVEKTKQQSEKINLNRSMQFTVKKQPAKLITNIRDLQSIDIFNENRKFKTAKTQKANKYLSHQHSKDKIKRSVERFSKSIGMKTLSRHEIEDLVKK